MLLVYSIVMLEVLLGNRSAEKVLLFMANYNDAYASQIATTFGASLYSIQKQLMRLEQGGVLVSQLRGKIRIYTWNPRFVLKKELVALLNRSLELLPKEERSKYFRSRSRPRRSGKPL